MKSKPIKKEIRLVLMAAAIIVVIGACVGVIIFNRSKTVFDIDASMVRSITLQNANKLTQVEITEPTQIENVVNLINGFTYTYSQERPPATGWNYRIDLETDSDWIGFEFWEDGVKTNSEDGSLIFYYGKTGYFDSLVTLADNATDLM